MFMMLVGYNKSGPGKEAWIYKKSQEKRPIHKTHSPTKWDPGKYKLGYTFTYKGV